MAPLVSIVIPYYNGSKYIETALKSIDEQTYDDMEIVVVDDGSDQGELNIIETVREELDTSLQLVCHDTNQGISAARNTGIEESAGEYVTVLDQDDIMLSEKIQTQVDLMERQPELGMTMTNVVHVDEAGCTMEVRKLAPGIENKSTGQLITDVFRCWVEKGGPLPLTTELTRASVYEDVGTYDTTLFGANDREFLFRVADEYRVQVINQPLLKKRYHPGNASNADQKLLEDRIRITETATEHHPSLAQYADRRFAFLWLISVRKHLSNGRLFLAVSDYLRALRTAPTFTVRRTAYFPVKVTLGKP